MKAVNPRRSLAQQNAALTEAIQSFRAALGNPSFAWAQQRLASTTPADGEGVLRRLLEHDAVPAAFATIPPPERGHVLQAAIICDQASRDAEAEMKSRTRSIGDARNSAKAARRALQTIKNFLGTDAVSIFPGDYAEELVKLLGRLSEGIEDRAAFNEGRYAERPRKRDPASARSRGIGWIKEAVKRACGGRPNLEAVRVIAEAALGTVPVTIEMVRNAKGPIETARWAGPMVPFGRQKTRERHKKRPKSGRSRPKNRSDGRQ